MSSKKNRNINRHKNIKNFWFSQPNLTEGDLSQNGVYRMSAGGSVDPVHNLSNVAVPVQFHREYYDIKSWKLAISEAEMLPYPSRVRMQRIYIDVINNGHVQSCMNKRKNLNLSKTYVLSDDMCVVNDEWTKWMNKPWFYQYINDVLDARFFGYTLISLGDIDKNYDLNKLSVVRRWLVSPDRENVANIEYMNAGTPFLEGAAAPWHIWVKTPTDVGVSGCGYGLLFSVALNQIVIKDNLSYNLTYNELFSSPTKVLKSSANDPKSREADVEMLENQGNAAGMVIRLEDNLEFIEAKGGNGYRVFPDIEKRMQDEITSSTLGHRAAIDAVPGQLGDSGEKSAAGEALRSVEISDNMFLMPYLNVLIERLRFLGVPIPEGLTVKVLNNDEEDEEKEKTMKNLLDMSVIMANMAKAGQSLDIAYVEELTGAKLVKTDIIEKTVGDNNI